jgi:GPH family glycoside/pentoside/hexuronide:cation symporter
MSTMTTDRGQRWRSCVGYCAGSFGANVAIWPINSLLMYFLTDTVALSVALATMVVTAPKLWDIVVDPAIGAWADRYAIQRGSRARVLMLAAALIPAMVSLVFLLPAQAAPWMAALAVIVLIVKSSAFMAFFISQVALADDIERLGTAHRDTMLAWRVVGQAMGGLAASACGPLLIVAFGGGQPGYAGMALVLSLVAFACLAALAFTARRYATAAASARVGGNLLAALTACVRNRTAALLIGCHLLVCVATGLVSTFLPYANKLFIGAGDATLSYLFSAIMVGMLAGSGIAALATRKVSRMHALACSAAAMTAAAALLYPVSAPGQLALSVLALALWGVGLGAYALLVYSSMMDVAGRATAGAAGLLLGLLISVGKIGDSLGGVIVGALLSWNGYLPNVAQSASAVDHLRLTYTMAPMLAMLAATGLLCVILGAARSPAMAERAP